MADERDQLRRAKEQPVAAENRARRGRKTCPRCQKRLPIADFDHSSFSPDGFEPWCRHCMNKQRAVEQDISASSSASSASVGERQFLVSGCAVGVAVFVVLVVLAGISLAQCGKILTYPNDPSISTLFSGLATDCPRARQGDTNLAGGHLVGCDLSGVDLTGANLTGAYLAGANLTGANLGGANLTGANLGGADLSLTGLGNANLTGVVWSNTTCPDGSNSDGHANTCVGYGIG